MQQKIDAVQQATRYKKCRHYKTKSERDWTASEAERAGDRPTPVIIRTLGENCDTRRK